MALTYTQRSTPTAFNNTWRGFCWSEDLGLFVAVGSVNAGGTDSHRIMTSPDGITWTSRDLGVSAANTLSNVVWSPALGLFVLVKQSGTQRVATSPDGTTWTQRTDPGATQCPWVDVEWSPSLSLFVGVGTRGPGTIPSATFDMMTSPDGVTWTGRNIQSGGGWQSVCWSPDLAIFVATRNGSSPNGIFTSTNGTAWTGRSYPGIGNPVTTTAAKNIAWSPTLGLFAILKGSGDNPMLTSPDGITWTQRNMPTTGAGRPVWTSVCWEPTMGLFIVVGRDGSTNNNQVAYSADGINWTEEDPGVATPEPWLNVRSGGSLGYAVALADNTNNDGNSAMTIEAGATPPTITDVSPDFGYTRGGALSTNPTITITGTDFVNGLVVTFDGIEADDVVVTGSTQITCTYPPHAAGLVELRVTNPDDLFDTADFTYIAPFISAITPNHGPATGGTPVVITGDGFVANSEITFDDIPATAIVYVNDQTYNCTTPPHPVPGTVKVIILEP